MSDETQPKRATELIKALDKLDVITLFVDDVPKAKANAPTLVEPFTVSGGGTQSRFLLTIEVEDADSTCAELATHGVQLLNGPTDRPWGRRTAAFADPAGHVWEIAQILPG